MTSRPDRFRERVNLIRDSNLGIREKWTLFVIADHAGLNDDSGECFASMETLADEFSLGPSQSHETIRSLVNQGVVTRERKRNRASTLTVNWNALTQLRKPGIPGRRKSENSEFRKTGGSISESRNENSGEPNSALLTEHPKNTPINTRGARRRKGSRFDASEAKLPSNLDTPEFRSAWAEWCDYRSEKRTAITERACRMQLTKLSRAGPDIAAVAIPSGTCRPRPRRIWSR